MDGDPDILEFTFEDEFFDEGRDRTHITRKQKREDRQHQNRTYQRKRDTR